jgi:hypothetical protein
MADYMDYPEVKVDTKYGTLMLRFHDDEEKADKRDQCERHVAYVYGDLTIRGVQISVSTWVYYARREYHKGAELQTPITIMDQDYRSQYNRVKGSIGATPTDASRRIIQDLIEDRIRTAYEMNPDLILEAKKVRRYNEMVRAEQFRDEAKAALDAAEQELLRTIDRLL